MNWKRKTPFNFPPPMLKILWIQPSTNRKNLKRLNFKPFIQNFYLQPTKSINGNASSSLFMMLKNKLCQNFGKFIRQNLKFVRRLETSEYHTSQLSKRLKRVKKQLDALKSCLSAEKRTYYKVNEPNCSIDSAAYTIADALLNDPQAVQLVARSDCHNLEMDKSWVLMSELDKDELHHKKSLRYL